MPPVPRVRRERRDRRSHSHASPVPSARKLGVSHPRLLDLSGAQSTRCLLSCNRTGASKSQEALLELDETELSPGEQEWLTRLRGDIRARAGPAGTGDGGVRRVPQCRTLRRWGHPRQPDPPGSSPSGARGTILRVQAFSATSGRGWKAPVGRSSVAIDGRYHGIYLQDPQFPDGKVGPGRTRRTSCSMRWRFEWKRPTSKCSLVTAG